MLDRMEYTAVKNDDLDDMAKIQDNVKEAIRLLHDMIGGGEEDQGLDAQISSVIRTLEGDAWEVYLRNKNK